MLGRVTVLLRQSDDREPTPSIACLKLVALTSLQGRMSFNALSA